MEGDKGRRKGRRMKERTEENDVEWKKRGKEGKEKRGGGKGSETDEVAYCACGYLRYA